MNVWGTAFLRTLLAVLAAALLAGCGPSSPEEHLAAARNDLAKNDRAAAVIHLRNAVQKNPDLGEARFLLGKALLESGEPAAAEKELRKAVQLRYAADQSVPALARSMLALGQAKKVVDEFGSTEIGSPEGIADLQATIGAALLRQGNVSAAQAAFTAAHAASPDYPRALVGEAAIKAGAGDTKTALELVDRALAKAPGLAEAWQLKGGILTVQEQPDAALAAFRKASEADRMNLTSHAAVINILMRQGKMDEAALQLEAMKKAAPKHPQTLYLQAWMAYTQKNHVAANEAIQQQLKAAPDNLAGLLLGGAIDRELKAYSQAEAKLLKVLSAVPRQRMAARLLTVTYLDSGQSAKAMEVIRSFLPAIEKDPDMLRLAGTVFMQNGDVDNGTAYFEKAAALDPDNTKSKTTVALAHLAKGDGDRALAELEQAAAADSGTQADMALIAAHLRKRQFDKALSAIDAMEKKQPGSAMTANLRGTTQVGKGDVTGARQSFERALTLEPGYFPAAANLARLDLAEKKPDDARKRFEAVLAKDPKNAQAALALVQLRGSEGGAPAEVGAMLVKAIAANPTDESLRVALIHYYLRNKDPGKALDTAQDAVAALPNRPPLVEALGRAQYGAGDKNQALTTYRKLAELMPGSPVPYLRMAEVQAASGEKDKALQSLLQALAIKPDDVETQRRIIALDLDGGRMTHVVAKAREIQKQRPRQSVGFMLEGDVYASRKSWAEAATAYRAGLKQAGTVDLAVRLDSVLRMSNSQAEADKLAAAWLKEHPADTVFRIHLAQVATARKDYAVAAQHYGALVAAQPGDPIMLNNLAWSLGQAKDPRALEYAEKAYKLAPNSPVVMDTLGVLLVERGDTRRGIELLQKASELAPNAAAIRLNLAKALLKEGQKEAARKELATLEKLGDTYPARAEVAQLMKGL